VPGRPTAFTELVGCRWPVQVAAMGGGVGGRALAAAVQEAGGLGMVSWGEDVPDGCGVNFLVPFVRTPADVTAGAGGARVVELFYGEPDALLVDAAREAGAVVGWQVGSVGEARRAVDSGCDYVVAQGVEAGGHVRGTSPLDDLLPAVLAAVGVPVVASGGIATAERVAELVARGAGAVRVGTRFLACPEAAAHPDYVANLLDAGDGDTELTEWFDDGWPAAPHRVLRASLEAARSSGRRSPLPPTRGTGGPTLDMAQYAGAGVGAVTRVEPAAEVVADLVRLL
jgi:NAD(P)H-dependent flavin oxidoreductase YrpB (nitropropane dioxygenase family)